MRVGFIGLGIMGKPMVRNLIRAGYKLVVYNRTESKADELVREGAEAAENPRKVAERTDIVITMLPDSPDVKEVVEGADGIFAGAREGSLLIDRWTIYRKWWFQEMAAAPHRKVPGITAAPIICEQDFPR